MASLLENLFENLTMQEETFSLLTKFAVDKKEAIIKNDTSKLQSIMAQENEYIGKSVHLGKNRDKILHDIAFVLNVKKNTVSLSELIELINSEQDKERLISFRKNLVSLLNNLRELNEINERLIKYSLEYIDYSMNILRNYINPEPAYFDASGNEINTSSRMFFDTKQ